MADFRFHPVNPDLSANWKPTTEQPAQTSGSSGGNLDPRAVIEQYQQGIDPKDPQGVEKLYNAIKGAGYDVEMEGDRIRFAGHDHGWIDVLRNKSYVEGRGDNRAWVYQPYHSKEDGRRLRAEGRHPEQLAGREPMPGQPGFTGRAPEQGGGIGNFQTGTFTGGGQYPLSSVMGSGLAQPWTTPFKAPNVTDDPGYRFRMDEAQNALERSAAAKGTLRTGGFIKDLAGHMQGLASQEYGNAYDRAMGEYNMAYGIYDRNQANMFSRLSSLSSTGLNAANSYGTNATNLITGSGNADAAATVARGNANQGAIDGVAEFGGGLAGYLATRPRSAANPEGYTS